MIFNLLGKFSIHENCPDSSYISTAFKADLDKVISKMKANEKLHVVVHGHTDDVGDANSNKILAEKRAKKVIDYMTANGIDISKIKLLSSGEESPVGNNDTDEGRSKNRRVEVLLLEYK